MTRYRKSCSGYDESSRSSERTFSNVKIAKNIFKIRDYGSWLEATSTTRSRGSTCDLRQMACKAYGISAFYGQERRFEDR